MADKKTQVRKLLYLDRKREISQEIFLDKFKQLFGFSFGEWQERSTTEEHAGEESISWSDENISVGLTCYYPERVYARPRAVKNHAKPIVEVDRREQEKLHEQAVASLSEVFHGLFGVTYSVWSTSEYLKQRIRKSYF